MKKEITEVIKSFEDAAKATGRPTNVDFSNVPEDLRGHFEAHYQIVVITEALNEGWKPNWGDSNEAKYFPYFWHEDTDGEEEVSSGFVFNDTTYDCSDAYAGYGLRLCFKTRALAKYVGEQFIEIWNKVLLK